MTIEGLLFLTLEVLLLLNWPVAIILILAARKKPRIRALEVMATSALLIAAGLSTYVFAVDNALAGYPLPKEAAQVLLRLFLLGLGLFPLWFLWLYTTGRFNDGS